MAVQWSVMPSETLAGRTAFSAVMPPGSPGTCHLAKYPPLRPARTAASPNSLHERFERVMLPFRGSATKNLNGYASRFIARSVRTEPEHVEDACHRLMEA